MNIRKFLACAVFASLWVSVRAGTVGPGTNSNTSVSTTASQTQVINNTVNTSNTQYTDYFRAVEIGCLDPSTAASNPICGGSAWAGYANLPLSDLQLPTGGVYSNNFNFGSVTFDHATNLLYLSNFAALSAGQTFMGAALFTHADIVGNLFNAYGYVQTSAVFLGLGAPVVLGMTSSTPTSTPPTITTSSTTTTSPTSHQFLGATVMGGGTAYTTNTDFTHLDVTTQITNTTYNETTYNVSDLVGEVAYSCPIILDLSGSGEPDVSHHDYLPHAPTFYTDKMAVFDLAGTGVPQLMEWVGPNSGILAVPDQNGQVTSALQLFGNAGGWSDGYEKLETLYDKNHDGVISGDELKGLYVWINKAGDGKVHPGELVLVQSLGIKSISAKHNRYESWYQLDNGTMRKTWDWWPSMKFLKKTGEMVKTKE